MGKNGMPPSLHPQQETLARSIPAKVSVFLSGVGRPLLFPFKHIKNPHFVDIQYPLDLFDFFRSVFGG